MKCPTLRPWSVPRSGNPTPAKTKPPGFVRSAPVHFRSRRGGQFRENLPGDLGFCHARSSIIYHNTLQSTTYVSCFCLLTHNPHALWLAMVATQEAANLEPSRKKNARWSHEDNKIFVDSLKAHQSQGHQSDNGWKNIVWTSCEVALQGSETRSGGGPKTADGCKEHWGTVCSSFGRGCTGCP